MSSPSRPKQEFSPFHRTMIKLKVVSPDITPVNWEYIGLTFLALLASSLTLTFLYPFLPEMVTSFGYSEEEKGKYSGYIGGAVFAGRALGSVFWGWLADYKGRKLVLLLTIALNGIFAGLFGFARDIWLAIFFRFMCGVANGTVGTAKAILYDITDNSNQAVGMSFMGMAWATGLIIGPLMGGLLATPATKYPEIFDSGGIFGQYPYLLSSLFPFAVCIIIFIWIWIQFDDTFLAKRNQKESFHSLGKSILSLDADPISSYIFEANQAADFKNKTNVLNGGMTLRSLHPNLGESVLFEPVTSASTYSKSAPDNFTTLESEDDSSRKIAMEGTARCRDNQNINQQVNDDVTDNEVPERTDDNASVMEDVPLCCCMVFCCDKLCCKAVSKSTIAELLQHSDVWASVTVYSMFSFVTIAMVDLFPVFASTITEYGGLGFTTNEIGVALGAMMLPMLFIQIKLYPYLVNKIGVRMVNIYGSVLCLVGSQSLPLIRLLSNQRALVWVFLMLIQVPFNITCTMLSAGTSLLINNSSPQHLSGQVNGLAMMCTAVGRTVAPIFSGSMFTWVVTYGPEFGIPFDTSFPFFVLGLTYGIICIQSLYINPRLDKQNK